MITDQVATEQPRYLAVPVCTPRSAEPLRSTLSAAELIIICRCARQLGATPLPTVSQQRVARLIESSVLGLLCSLKQKVSCFSVVCFLVITALCNVLRIKRQYTQMHWKKQCKASRCMWESETPHGTLLVKLYKFIFVTALARHIVQQIQQI